MNSAFSQIAQILKDNSEITGLIKAYAFGSATRPNTIPNDIDLLIVYNTAVQPNVVRRLLDDLGYMPIHILFMFPEEEKEKDFIASQKCIQIF